MTRRIFGKNFINGLGLDSATCYREITTPIGTHKIRVTKIYSGAMQEESNRSYQPKSIDWQSKTNNSISKGLFITL